MSENRDRYNLRSSGASDLKTSPMDESSYKALGSKRRGGADRKLIDLEESNEIGTTEFQFGAQMSSYSPTRAPPEPMCMSPIQTPKYSTRSHTRSGVANAQPSTPMSISTPAKVDSTPTGSRRIPSHGKLGRKPTHQLKFGERHSARSSHEVSSAADRRTHRTKEIPRRAQSPKKLEVPEAFNYNAGTEHKIYSAKTPSRTNVQLDTNLNFPDTQNITKYTQTARSLRGSAECTNHENPAEGQLRIPMEHREVSGQDCLDSSDSSLPLSRTPPHPAKNIRLSIDSIQNSPQRHTLAYPCHGDVTPPRPQPFVVPSAPGRKRTSFVPKDDSSSENSSLDDFDGIYPRNYERTRTVPVNIPRINPDIATPNLSNRIAKLSVRKVSPPVIESSDDDLSPEPIECSPSSTLKGHLSLPSKYVSKIEVRDVVGARVNPILKKPPLEGSESGAIALEKISFYDNKMDRSPNFLEIFGVNRSKTKPAPKADT